MLCYNGTEVNPMAENVWLFYGEDVFHIKSRINQLIRQHDIDEFNVTTYDCEEVDIDEAVNDAMTIPFMSEKKAVVAKNALFLSPKKKGKNEPDQDPARLVEYLEHPPEETLFIVTVPHASLNGKLKAVKMLKGRAKVVECRLKSSQDLTSWVKRQLANQGLHIETDALKELMKRIGTSTEMAYLELKKLLLYATDMETIDVKTIEKVITKNIEDNVYEITNALLGKDHKRALEVYHDLILYSEDPLRILGIVVAKFREMLEVKTLLEQGYSQSDIQQHFGVKSGRAYFMVENAKTASKEMIEKHLEHLEHLDFSIKSGRLDKKTALELFILST